MDTRKEKRLFIRSLIRSVQNEVLEKVPKMPRDWDGHELRQYLADKFGREICGGLQNKRRRKYLADIYNNNL